MKQVIQIRCKNNKKSQKVEIGSTLFDIFSAFDLKMTHGPVSARVNNKVEGMHYRVYNSKDVEFLDMTSSSGSRAYTRTLFFVLCKAVQDIYPATDVVIDIPVSNGFYVDIRLGRPVVDEDVNIIRRRMQEIIDARMPIRRFTVPTEEAVALFQEKGDVEKVKLLIANGMFYSFAGCYFPGRLPTMVDQELFRCFTEQLDHYFRETGFYSQSMPQRQQMIHDLLRYGEENPELVRDRARGLRLPETGDFRLGYVEFDEQASTSKAGYMVLQLRAWSNVANYGVMQYQNSVLILFQDWHDYPVGEQLLFRERWDELLTLLGKNHAHIGVSLLFTELGRLRMGYDQARTAIEIGRKLDPDALEYHYSKYYLNDMLECYREKFALDDVIVRYLDQLAGERGYSNSNLLLLYHYLNTERNISLTAKRVHMHRNSVIYRLQRIQDVLNLDLDDPDVRLRLMITFKILRMEGKLPEITDEPPEPDNGGSDRLTLVE